MARPLRIEYAGAFHHAYARGNDRTPIFLDDTDRLAFLGLLHETVSRFGWRCHAYCLMGNHYHLCIETLEPTLSRGMRHLNGVYTQWFNARHQRVGHVLQGRFKSSVVESGGYFRELCRYIVLNPVRANLCRTAGEWQWSSYRATVGQAQPTHGLTTSLVTEQFGGASGFEDFVAAARDGRGACDDAFRESDPVVGSADFLRQCLRRELPGAAREALQKKLAIAERPSLPELFARIRSAASRKRHLGAAVAEAFNQRYRTREIADFLNLRPDYIRQIARSAGKLSTTF